MWQVEDLLRANTLSLDKIKESVIASFDLSDENRNELAEWYGNLIEMMRIEGVAESGHLQINKVTLQKLEELTGSWPGVDKAYAIQAGREVRIMVKPEVVTEDNMILLARDIAKKIEAELEYPGQIKINVIRETKAVEYAK